MKKAIFTLLTVFAVLILTAGNIWAQQVDIVGNPYGGNPYATIQDAIDACTGGETINLAAGTYEITSQIDVDRDISIVGLGAAIIKANNPSWSTVNGQKHLIGIYAGTQVSPVTISNITMDCNNQCFGVNTYNNAYGDLSDVDINDGKGAGLTVNGSTIIATNLNTSGNAWGAVNVDPGSGVTDPTVFTLNSGNLGEDNQIWSDRSYVTGTATVTVNTPVDYSEYIYDASGVYIWINRELTNVATISKNGETRIYSTIQSAIDVATSGDVIDVAAGIYNETLNITKANLQIVGTDRANVVIDATGLATNNAGIYVNAADVSIKTLTLQSTVTNSLPRYGIKFGIVDGCILEDVTVKDVYRSGIDALGTSNLLITNVSSMDNGGHGIALTDCNGVTVTDITLSGNAWQNVSVATWGRYSPLGTSGIVFSGTNTFGDLFQLEMGDYNNPGVPPAGDAIITYSTNILDGADVTVQASDFGFALHGVQDDAPDQERIWFFSTLANAAVIPTLAPTGHWTDEDMYIESLTDNTMIYVTPGCDIQAAINAAAAGDVVNVTAGTYLTSGKVIIDKNLTLTGEDKLTTIIKSSTDIIGGSSSDPAWFLVQPGVEFNVNNFTFNGEYPTRQINFGICSYGTGIIENNIFKDIRYGTYNGRGVVIYGDVLVQNNEFANIGRIGVHIRKSYVGSYIGTGTVKGNTYVGKGTGDFLDYGIEIGAASIATLESNNISECKGVASSDGSTSAGILATDYYGTGTEVEISENTIFDNSSGVVVGYDTPDATIANIHNNNIYDNDSFGVSALVNTIVDATNNWWGDASGPSGFGPGIGDAVSDFVSFDPWIGKAETQTASGAVPLTVNFPTSGVDITFNTLPVGGGTVTVQRYNEAPSGYPAPPAGATNAGLWLDITSSMPNYSFSADVTIDVTGLGFDATTSIMYFNITTNTWVVVNNGTYAAGAPETYTFTTNHFTPFSFINTPGTAYNIYLASSPTTAASSVIYPNDAWGSTTNDWDFTAPIDLYIVPEDGSIFGASDIVLQWDNTLFSYVGVDETGGLYDGSGFEILYNQLGAVDQVTINATRLDNDNFDTEIGDYIAKLQLNVLKPGFGPINFTSMDFRAFNGGIGFEGVYVVGNSAAVKSYLGDVASAGPDESTGDGLVDIEDLNLWASSYWSGVPGFAGGMTNYKVKYDVGPTADNTVYTLPTVDGMIQFEDMVIFAISYGLSGDFIYPKTAPAPETPVELIVGEPMYVGTETLVPVSINGTVVDVRAMELMFSGSFGKLLGIEKGALLQNLDAPVVLMDKSSANSANVDLAIFGADVEGLNAEGELLTLRFDGRADVQLSSASLRNSGNNQMNIEIINSDINAAPTSFALDQNYPNPFNPSTIISYQLPEQRYVNIAIFNMLGEEVSTLVNEVKEAGYHKIEWSGTNLTSGVYFYRIEAGDFVSVKKMMLMK